MSGSIVSKTTAILWFQEAVKGHAATTLTNYDNDLLPQIAAGSRIEIGQELYEFNSNDNIGGNWAGIANDTQVYIMFEASGSTAGAFFETTAPVWDDSKQGWYGTGALAAYRYLFRLYKDSSGNYTNKTKYESQNNFYFPNRVECGALDSGGNGTPLKFKEFDIGDWNMDTTASVPVTATGVTGTKIRMIDVQIRPDSGATTAQYPLNMYNTGGTGIVNGGVSGYQQGANSVISLYRTTGGFFDSTNFDATSYNRGWVTVWYTE